MSERIYVAAPRSEAPRARRMAGVLHVRGFVLVSTWYRRIREEADPRDPLVRGELRMQNRRELAEADIVVALCDLGVPRETYFEIAFALEAGRSVIWLEGPSGEGGCLSDSAPQVVVVRQWKEVAPAVERVAWGPKPASAADGIREARCGPKP